MNMKEKKDLSENVVNRNTTWIVLTYCKVVVWSSFDLTSRLLS